MIPAESEGVMKINGKKVRLITIARKDDDGNIELLKDLMPQCHGVRLAAEKPLMEIDVDLYNAVGDGYYYFIQSV